MPIRVKPSGIGRTPDVHAVLPGSLQLSFVKGDKVIWGSMFRAKSGHRENPLLEHQQLSIYRSWCAVDNYPSSEVSAIQSQADRSPWAVCALAWIIEYR